MILEVCMDLENFVKEKFIPRLNKGKLYSIRIDPINPADARGNYAAIIGLKNGNEIHEETFTETELVVIQTNYNWSETPIMQEQISAEFGLN